jgi:hypothetical protein
MRQRAVSRRAWLHHAAPVPIVGPFFINMKTAKALGLSLPPTLLAIADEVIE